MADPVLSLISVLLGLGGLWVGAALTLRGALRMIERDTRWEVALGSAVLGLAAALPEMGIAVVGAGWGSHAADVSGLIVGTAVGSVLARATLVLGSAVLLGVAGDEAAPLPRRPPGVLTAIILIGILAMDGALTRPDGIVLLVASLLYSGLRMRAGSSSPEEAPKPVHGLLPDAVLVGFGIVVIAAASWFVVPAGQALSAGWGASPLLVGLLVLAVGASLPELVFALSAATRGRAGPAASSVLRSGTVGLLLPLGLAAVITPIVVAPDVLRADLPALALAVLGLWAWGRERPNVPRWMGALLVVYFMGYALIRMFLG